MSHDLDHMIENPTEYGFEWGFAPINGKVGDTLVEFCANAPHIVHLDEDRMREVFGQNYFLDMANGTSGRVRDQDVTRSACRDDVKMRNDTRALQELVLERALGKTRKRGPRTTVIEKIVETRIFVASDGTEWTSKAELMAHEVDLKLAAE